jgi:hypothetical protein
MIMVLVRQVMQKYWLRATTFKTLMIRHWLAMGAHGMVVWNRVYQCGWFDLMACAVGADDDLGWALPRFSETASVQETASDYWQRVDSCP